MYTDFAKGVLNNWFVFKKSLSQIENNSISGNNKILEISTLSYDDSMKEQ